MPANPDRQFRPRMTLRQISILVAFAAVASAVVMPEIRGYHSREKLLVVVLVELPVALMFATFVLFRRGPLKLWTVTFLCAIPIALLDGFLNYSLYFSKIGLPSDPSARMSNLAVLALCEVTLLGCLALLGRVLSPRTCPICGRFAMLLDHSIPRRAAFPTPTEPRICLACGARFRRPKGGAWIDVDTLPKNR